jgi:hypothetical protein
VTCTRRGRVLVTPHERARAEVVADVLTTLRHSGMSIRTASAWAECDATAAPSFLVRADLVTSAHPPGWIQIAIRRRLSRLFTGLAFAVMAIAVARNHDALAAGTAAAAAVDLAIGIVRSGPGARRALTRSPLTSDEASPLAASRAPANVVGVA